MLQRTNSISLNVDALLQQLLSARGGHAGTPSLLHLPS